MRLSFNQPFVLQLAFTCPSLHPSFKTYPVESHLRESPKQRSNCKRKRSDLRTFSMRSRLLPSRPRKRALSISRSSSRLSCIQFPWCVAFARWRCYPPGYHYFLAPLQPSPVAQRPMPCHSPLQTNQVLTPPSRKVCRNLPLDADRA